MEKFNNIKAELEKITEDAEKFFVKENNAAGTRLRKGLQVVKNLIGDLRKDVSSAKKAKKAQ